MNASGNACVPILRRSLISSCRRAGSLSLVLCSVEVRTFHFQSTHSKDCVHLGNSVLARWLRLVRGVLMPAINARTEAKLATTENLLAPIAALCLCALLI